MPLMTPFFKQHEQANQALNYFILCVIIGGWFIQNSWSYLERELPFCAVFIYVVFPQTNYQTTAKCLSVKDCVVAILGIWYGLNNIQRVRLDHSSVMSRTKTDRSCHLARTCHVICRRKWRENDNKRNFRCHDVTELHFRMFLNGI